jgi:protein SCO1/2
MDSRSSQRIVWTVLIIALVGLGSFALTKWLRERHPDVQLDDYGAIPGFSLQNERGVTVTRSDLAGHIWIANLFFTRCTTVCPVMTAKMQSLQSSLKDQPNVLLISFSADPANDSASTLAHYAAEHHANPKQWSFLTGPVSTIYQITKNGFHLAIDSVGGDQTPPIVHSTRFVLVDRKGHVRGYFNGSAEEGLQKVLDAVNALQKEQPE